MVIAAVSAIAVLVVSLLVEPKGHMVEVEVDVDDDGKVRMIAMA